MQSLYTTLFNPYKRIFKDYENDNINKCRTEEEVSYQE